MKWSTVLAWRVGRQQLAARAPRDAPLSVVERIAGLHAQLTASAELTLWARVSALERDAVSRALWDERSLVKTWAMRGTLHLMPAEELGLWTAAQGALKPRHHVGAWLRHHALTREQADAMLAAIPAALDARQLTREELAVEVARITGIEGLDGKLRGGFGDLLKPAAFRGTSASRPTTGATCGSRGRTSGSGRGSPPTRTRRSARSRAGTWRRTGLPTGRRWRAGSG